MKLDSKAIVEGSKPLADNAMTDNGSSALNC
jgi:hypothetical protein